MSSNNKERKKEIMKDIIRKLHQGLPVEEAKKIFEEKIGEVSSTEIAEIEQALINEGVKPDEIKKFCNVHTLLFKDSLEKTVTEDTSPSHPLYLFKQENREIDKRLKKLKALGENGFELSFDQWKEKTNDILQELKKISIHYDRKEQVLFPYLEKAGFFGPSQVMWGKDNEIRSLLKETLAKLEEASSPAELTELFQGTIATLIEEIDGMIFKEEKILFPACLARVKPTEWAQILIESDEVGYIFIEKPEKTGQLIKELQQAQKDESSLKKDTITLPSGSFEINELINILNSLPVDITFIDKDDQVRYFSETKERIFVRTRSVIGRKVQNCHPPQSLDKVENIIQSFKQGRTEPYDFWIDLQGKKVYIRYFPIKDKQGKYLGILEVTQDISAIQKITGEKRI